MPIANINGVDLNYEVSGQGPAVVFLHGYTGSTQDWANQIRVLSPQYQVIALDHRGHGKSAAPSEEEDYSVEILATDTFGLLNMLGITKCCLGGHSLGGFTTLQFAVEHQDMLAGLVLVDTSSGQFGRDTNDVRIPVKTATCPGQTGHPEGGGMARGRNSLTQFISHLQQPPFPRFSCSLPVTLCAWNHL